MVKIFSTERKKYIKRGPDSELAGIFTTRLVNSVTPRGTDEQDNGEKGRLHVFSSYQYMEKLLHLCQTTSSAEYTNVLPYITVSSACPPFVINDSCIALATPLNDR